MAIIFTKAISESELLNSHNNNIVEFYSNSVLTSTKCTLNFGSVSFEITPDPSGNFSYNLKHAIKELINENNFEDQILPDIENDGYIYEDGSLYKLQGLTYTITFDNDTTEATTKNYIFTKSVKQPDRYDETIINSAIDLIGLLIPFRDYSVKSYAATYFTGYPFDIAIYSNIARTITIRNQTTNFSFDISVVKGVNRLFFSDGNQNFSFEDDLPLIYGENELEFIIGGSVKLTLFLDKKESGCGRFLKFYSSEGSYQYFLFDDIYTKEKKGKIIDNLQSKFEDIHEAVGQDRITGKTSSNIENLFTEYLSNDSMNYLQSIIDSPRVELYTRNQYEKQIATSWRSVVLLDSSHQIENTKKNLKRLAIQIGYTNNSLAL